MNFDLFRYLSRQNALAARRRVFNDLVFEQSGHTRTEPNPNRYRIHDIGTKNVRYPDGKVRSVATKKVRDTDNTTFLVFADSTQFLINPAITES